VPLPASAATRRAAALLLLTAGRQPCSNRSTAPARQALSRKPADFNQLLEEADDQLFERILNNLRHTLNQLLPPQSAASQNYTVSQKTRHQTLGHNFTNYYPIF